MASLAGTTYADVKERMFSGSPVRRTGTKDLRWALVSFGVAAGPRLVPLRTCHYRNLTCDAVLKVWPRRNGRDWHWVVWDARRRRVLDPLPEPYKHIKAISYLPVTRRR